MKKRKSIKMDRKPLSTPGIKAMKPGCKDLSDTGENAGLRVSCGATGNKAFYYRYRNPFNKNKTISMTFGHYPAMGLADARIEFQKLKAIRKAGRCPKTERDEQLQLEVQATLNGLGIQISRSDIAQQRRISIVDRNHSLATTG